MNSRPGCWTAVARCLSNRPKDDSARYRRTTTEKIEFENLTAAENRASAVRKQQQVVTELEREHVMSGNLDQLVEEQRRIDAEKDAELRRQEEALRLEEEAYYAAKREAAKKSRQTASHDQQSLPVTTESSLHPSMMGPSAVTSQPTRLSDGKVEGKGETTESKDEEDFDQFLESVKARQLSLTTKVAPTVSDTEEEVDFGFWEKAPLPTDQKHSTKEGKLKEVDLNLL